MAPVAGVADFLAVVVAPLDGEEKKLIKQSVPGDQFEFTFVANGGAPRRNISYLNSMVDAKAI